MEAAGIEPSTMYLSCNHRHTFSIPAISMIALRTLSGIEVHATASARRSAGIDIIAGFSSDFCWGGIGEES